MTGRRFLSSCSVCHLRNRSPPLPSRSFISALLLAAGCEAADRAKRRRRPAPHHLGQRQFRFLNMLGLKLSSNRILLAEFRLAELSAFTRVLPLNCEIWSRLGSIEWIMKLPFGTWCK